MKLSAGLLPFRRGSGLEVLIAHLGGPLWAKRDAGHWSLIKGEVAPGEDPRVTAAREFSEETGWLAPLEGWIELGSVRLRSGKIVNAWAIEADFDPSDLRPGTFRMFWGGREREFPEIDQVRWCDPPEATRLLNPAQAEFLRRLETALAG
ncbi:MAG: NUDIX domain-containing protein [Actinomycetota bacterium]